MSKNWRMLAGLLFLGSVGTLQAHPLDLPDIVYIDGLPCNSACQSYMAWSRQKKSSTAEQPATGETCASFVVRRSSPCDNDASRKLKARGERPYRKTGGADAARKDRGAAARR